MTAADRLRRLAGAANDSRAGSMVRRAMPEPLWQRVAAAVGGRLPEPIDLAPLALLRDVDPRDATALEAVLPRLGLADDVPQVLPAELQPHVGTGVRHWQYPNQFAPYLAHVASLGVRSYLEIGVRHGGTFLITTELLKPERAVGVDIDRVPALSEHEVLQADSRSRRFRRLARSQTWDLVLVDGNHAYDAVRSDVETVLPHANVIALHDIVDQASPGVRRAWAELREQPGFDFFEYTAQYDEVVERVGSTVLGIGLAVRRDRLPSAGEGTVPNLCG
jgi:predicted O-methyltransferase YrrM